MEEFYGQSQPPHDGESAEVIMEFESNDEKEKRLDQIAPRRNYGGDWTLLFHNRLKNPRVKERFLKSKDHNETVEIRPRNHFANRPGISLTKPSDVPIDEYVQSQAGYDTNIDGVFNHTHYGVASEFSKAPHNKGVSRGYGDQGVVFNDATTTDMRRKLTSRQKNIIEAHEKAHGIFDRLTEAEKKIILQPFDRIKIQYGHKAHADEVLARMSQLKNYFGFAGNEEFTLDHLIYARENYIKDTGMDNNMSDFFAAITDERKLVENMNTFAC